VQDYGTIYYDAKFYQSFMAGCNNPPYMTVYEARLTFRKSDGTTKTRIIGMGNMLYNTYRQPPSTTYYGSPFGTQCAIVNGSSAALSWTTEHLCENYDIELYKNGQLTGSYYISGHYSNNMTVGLSGSGSYSWKIRGKNSTLGNSSWSSLYPFTYTAPSPITGNINSVMNPQPSKPIHSITSSFNCSSGHNITSYSWILKKKVGTIWQDVGTSSSSTQATTHNDSTPPIEYKVLLNISGTKDGENYQGSFETTVWYDGEI
jgi:hypothetical protein